MEGRVGRRTGFLILGAGLAGLLALAPGTALGNHVNCGQVINKSTSLDKNLTCAGDAIVIGADNITLNLNGYTLQGNGTGDGVDNGAGYDGVVIKSRSGRGAVKGFSTGVRIGGEPNGSDGPAEGNQLTALSTTENTSNGIRLGAGTTGATLHNNRSFTNPVGIRLRAADGNTLTWNRVTGNSTGIFIESTTSDGNGSDGNTLRLNTLTGNTSRGILVQGGDDNVLERNNAPGNFHGIEVVGVAAAATSSSEAPPPPQQCSVMPSLPGCRSGGPTTSASPENQAEGNILDGNRVKENGGDGIFVGGLTTGTLLEDNDTDDNTDDGIEVTSGPGATTLTDNDADDNGDWGILAPGQVDGGSNDADDNGQPQQCAGVDCS